MSKEILDSKDFLKELLAEGVKKIIEARDSGNIEARVKGTFETGVTDDIALPDIEVGNFYFDQTKLNFPEWKCFVEDHPQKQNPSEFKKGDIGVFYDPLDGTKLLIEGKPGYSTMAGVTIHDGNGFKPVLGMFYLVDGEFVWAYDDGTEKQSNLEDLGLPKKSERALDALILGRTPIERKGLLTPIAKKLGYDVKLIRGIAPQTMALLNGETDLFIYEPGIGLSDIIPVTPIIKYCGGDVTDLKGQEIIYTGNPELDRCVVVSNKKGKDGLKHGALAKREYVPEKRILEAVAELHLL